MDNYWSIWTNVFHHFFLYALKVISLNTANLDAYKYRDIVAPKAGYLKIIFIVLFSILLSRDNDNKDLSLLKAP